MTDVVIENIASKLKAIYEQAEIYQGNYAELDTKENGIIRAIGRLDNPRVSDVSRELHISMSTASWCIDRLEKKKYLVRRRSEVDRRTVFLTLTKKGKAICEQFDSIFERLAISAKTNLNDTEMRTFMELLERIDIIK